MIVRKHENVVFWSLIFDGGDQIRDSVVFAHQELSKLQMDLTGEAARYCSFARTSCEARRQSRQIWAD